MKKTLFAAFVLGFALQPAHLLHAAAPTALRGLLVLIDFSDRPATMTVDRASEIVNGPGYTEPTVTHSLRDYWFAETRGKVVLTHQVVGYYRAPMPAASYTEFPQYVALLKSALDWVAVTYPDLDWNALSLANGALNRSDTSEEGRFLSIGFMTTAWIPGTGGTHEIVWMAPNGVQTKQVVGATFESPWDSNVNLFWLTHELGHAIWAWPDTYDTTANSHGTGLYSLMSGNQYTGDIEPPGGPFLLAEGWARPVAIKQGQTIVLTPDGETVAYYANPSDAREYFVIEARDRSTIGNSAFPVKRGLVIWHVDERVTTSNTKPQMTAAEHYRISVEQADGRFDLERNVNTGDAGDVFGPGASFGEWTTPDSNWWDGSASGLTIDGIRFLPNGRIQFRVRIE